MQAQEGNVRTMEERTDCLAGTEDWKNAPTATKVIAQMQPESEARWLEPTATGSSHLLPDDSVSLLALSLLLLLSPLPVPLPPSQACRVVISYLLLEQAVLLLGLVAAPAQLVPLPHRGHPPFVGRLDLLLQSREHLERRGQGKSHLLAAACKYDPALRPMVHPNGANSHKRHPFFV